MGCDNCRSKEKYSTGKKDDGRNFQLIFTLRARRRLSYAALLRIRSKPYDVTLRRLAYESLRLVQNPGAIMW